MRYEEYKTKQTGALNNHARTGVPRVGIPINIDISSNQMIVRFFICLKDTNGDVIWDDPTNEPIKSKIIINDSVELVTYQAFMRNVELLDGPLDTTVLKILADKKDTIL